jgi:hypothetical protein
MKQTAKVPISYSLDGDVIAKVHDVASDLGLSDSALVNMQLKLAFGMVDEESREFLQRGLPEVGR